MWWEWSTSHLFQFISVPIWWASFMESGDDVVLPKKGEVLFDSVCVGACVYVWVCLHFLQLTSCIHGSAAMLYPMFWQHVYIPVLPQYLIDYCWWVWNNGQLPALMWLDDICCDSTVIGQYLSYLHHDWIDSVCLLGAVSIKLFVTVKNMCIGIFNDS